MYERRFGPDAEFHCLKGVLAMVQDQLDLAESHLLTGITIDSDNADLAYNLAYLYERRGETTKALSTYLRAFALSDSEESAQETRRQISQLVSTCVEAIRENPDRLDLLEGLLLEDVLEGSQVDEVLAVVEQVAGRDDVPAPIGRAFTQTTGDLYRRCKGDLKAAGGWYGRLLAGDRYDEAAFARLLPVLIQSEKFTGTINYLESSYDNDTRDYQFLADQCKKLGQNVLREHFQYKVDTAVTVKPARDAALAGEAKGRVAIIIPAYNQKGFLREAIESAIAQDYDNLEVIVGDDHSTDGTDEMMREFKDNPRVRYIRNEKNLGPGNNSRNLLYNHTNAEFVMILNHDDYLARNDYISKAAFFLQSHPSVAFVWANCYMRNMGTGEMSQTRIKVNEVTNGLEYFLNYETGSYAHITGVLTTVFRRRPAIDLKCLTEMSKSKDLFLYLKLMLTGDVGFIEDLASVYRIHGSNISGNMPIEFDYSTLEELENLKAFVLRSGFRRNWMEKWMTTRVFSFVNWRFRTMWGSGRRKEALKLLWEVSVRYPAAYEAIVGSLQ